MPGTCTACGGSGQACCGGFGGGGLGTCDMGLMCTAGTGGAAAACQPCGGSGQACCGGGAIATRTCDTGLTCGATDGGAPACR